MQADIYAQAYDVIESSALLICIFILEKNYIQVVHCVGWELNPTAERANTSNMVYRGKYVLEVVSTAIGAVAPLVV